MKANTLDLRVGDHFIHEGKEFVVTEEESIGCVAEVLEPDEEWTGEYGYLFAAEVVEKVEPKKVPERKIDLFIKSCPYLTEEYKEKLIEAYSDEQALDDVVAGWIYETIREDLQKWYNKASDEWVP